MDEELCVEIDESPDDLDSLASTLTRLARYHRCMAVGYFGSLGLLAFSAYSLVGPFGGVIVVASFGVYFFHLNMRVSGMHVKALGSMLSGLTKGHASEPIDSEAGQGQYL